MAIIIRCSGCQQKLKAPEHMIGKEKACPKCGRLLPIRPETPPPLPQSRRTTIPRSWLIAAGSAYFTLCILVLGIVLLANYGGDIADQSVAAAGDVPASLPDAEPHDPVREVKAAEEAVANDKPQPELEGKQSTEELFAAASPAVLTISIKNDNGDVIGSGSGFLVENRWIADRYDGFEADRALNRMVDPEHPHQVAYLLTNYHVMESAVDADVQLSNGVEGYVGDVLTEDENADLALLEVRLRTDRAPQMLALAESMPRVGAPVYAIGSPQGLQNTLSTGIISGIRELEPGSQWLQTTASISPGSSGGPLLGADGKVVGITTAFLSQGQNLNFAAPISAIHELLDSPFKTRELWRGVSYLEEADAAYLDYCSFVFSERRKESSDNSINYADVPLPLREAEILHKKGKYKEAIEIATRSLDSVPDEFEYLAYFTIARAAYEMARQKVRESEIRSLDEIYEKMRKNRYSTIAVEMLQKAINANPDFSPSHAYLVNYRTSAGEWEAGVTAASTLIDVLPRNWGAYFLRGSCLNHLERKREALVDFQNAIELDPLQGKVHSNLASTYSDLAEYQNAILAYEKAAALKFRPGMCYFNIGKCYKRIGRFQLAIEAFQTAAATYELEDQESRQWFESRCNSEIAECNANL